MANPFANAAPSPDAFEENFELVGSRPLGQGAFATTWRARVLDRGLIEDYGTAEVALKIPVDKNKERALKKEVNLNAALEARLRRINSSNVVRYLGVDVFQGRLVMVMEFVPGGSLRNVLEKEGPKKRLSIDKAVRITEGILRGLSLIHAEQILHRDVKPDNVLMGENDPKISDLGISRFLESFDNKVTTAGTLEYMAPELIEGKAKLNADVWSVGITLYEMLTGVVPFPRTTNIRAHIESIVAGSFPPACEIRNDVPVSLSEVIDRALKKNPADRFETAREMLEALSGPSGSFGFRFWTNPDQQTQQKPEQPEQAEPVAVPCPHCGVKVLVKVGRWFKKVRCPRCNSTFRPSPIP
jgi:serine/threonine protein kinase